MSPLAFIILSDAKLNDYTKIYTQECVVKYNSNYNDVISAFKQIIHNGHAYDILLLRKYKYLELK